MATDIEKMRVLIPDAEQIYDNDYLFDDDDLQTYLEVANGNPLRAAGYAVMAIATSEAIISKVIRTQDLQTNGATLAEALRKQAELLFKRADDDEAKADGFYMNIVDYDGVWPRPELTEFATGW